MQKSVLISYGSETINYGLKNQNLFSSAFQKYKCSTIQIVEFPKKTNGHLCFYIKNVYFRYFKMSNFQMFKCSLKTHKTKTQTQTQTIYSPLTPDQPPQRPLCLYHPLPAFFHLIIPSPSSIIPSHYTSNPGICRLE